MDIKGKNPGEVQEQVLSGERRIALSGISHKCASVELREKFSIEASRQEDIFRELLESEQVRETVLLSTCNRTEIVLCGEGSYEGLFGAADTLLESISGVSKAEFSGCLYRFKEREAVEHLFSVASGLDSMVVGEPQVLGQLKDAYAASRENGAAGLLLSRLFDRAFVAAKAVRTRTTIGHGAVSVCYAARELAAQIFGELGSASVLLIGAGETGELALKHFRSAGAGSLCVANKTFSRAVELAEQCRAAAIDLNSLSQELPRADIVIGAASRDADAPFLVCCKEAQHALNLRHGEPQFYIDLGVPRNFDSDISDLEDCFLYTVDDLQAVAAENAEERLLEIDAAREIVDEEARKFLKWRERLVLEPEIRAVFESQEKLQAEEINRTLRRLKHEGFSSQQCQVLEQALRDFGHSITAKTFHRPVAVLREGAERRQSIKEIFRSFFLGQ